jgi:putative DNA-invertase from lambdoid prophage Rac
MPVGSCVAYPSIDMTTPIGRLMVQLVAALAEFEKGIINERVRSGLRRAQEEGTRSGKAIGRPRRDFDVALAKRLRVEGRSWRQVAVAVKVPVATIRRTLLA